MHDWNKDHQGQFALLARALAPDSEERPLFVAARDEGTPEALARYGAWLTRRGDARGAWMSALAIARGGAATAEAGREARRRIDALGPAMPPLWASFFLRAAGPFNCHAAPDEYAPELRFAFECPRTWDSLEPTSDPKVRHCDACGEPVHLCDTREQAEASARAGRCITIPASLAERVRQDVTRAYTGRPHFPTAWGRRIFYTETPGS